MQHTTHILSTRPLPDAMLREAAAEDIIIDTLSFIHTEACSNKDTEQEIQQLYVQDATVVFTSMNAVEAVAAVKHSHQPSWKIFCIGETTASLVKQHFGETSIIGTADSAQGLADVIIKRTSIPEVIFFCGDNRRPELPAALKGNNIKVNEKVVYQTMSTPHVIEKNYDGILFFSPSAVESFFSANTIDSNTILFAIGQTTGDTIKKFSGNRIITGIVPGKEELARQAVAYFKSANALH